MKAESSAEQICFLSQKIQFSQYIYWKMGKITVLLILIGLVYSQPATSFSTFLPRSSGTRNNLRFQVSSLDSSFDFEPFSTFPVEGQRLVYLGRGNSFLSDSGFGINGFLNFFGQSSQAASIPTLKDFFRDYDGTNNHRTQKRRGSRDFPLARRCPPAYRDGVSLPATYQMNPRQISNMLGQMRKPLERSRLNLTMAFTIWGQFLDHDVSLTQVNETEDMDIQVPECDQHLDPNCEGGKKIPFKRSIFHEGSSPREQMNMITAWVDGSQVYGSSKEESDRLRTFKLGKMRTDAGKMLPKRQNSNHNLLDAGDVRANQNILLTSFHTIFVRQHNRVCDLVVQESPGYSDEEIFQSARNYVIALLQKITYEDFLPHLLGQAKYDEYIGKYDGYDENVDPTVTTEFSTAAYRIGHSLLVGKYPLINRYGQIQQEFTLNDLFFRPDLLNPETIDGLFRGLSKTFMKEKSPEVINQIRNLLVTSPEHRNINLDLYSLNLQRSADHGLANFNEVREAYNLSKLTSFEEMTKDQERAERLKQVYGSPDNCDLWIGIISEDPVEGGVVGELGAKVIGEQFYRLRKADRFYYELILPPTTAAKIGSTTYAEVIMDNSGVLNLQRDIFMFSDRSF